LDFGDWGIYERIIVSKPLFKAANGDKSMIDLYTWKTPNGRKISIALEELGLEYNVKTVNISNGDQFAPDFIKISPNNKIPAIFDSDTGLSIMESGAILLYLADKTGRLIPKDKAGYWDAVQWMMWQMAGLGPMLGQLHQFVKFNPGKSPFGEERYLKEGKRLYGVLDRQLDGRSYVLGDLSIVDIAIWPWISRFEWQTIDIKEYRNVCRWYVELANRPSFQAGYDVPATGERIPMP
jgi:GST-like protein